MFILPLYYPLRVIPALVDWRDCPCAHTVFAKRLNDMNNMMKAKEDKLRVRHKDTHTAIQWLRENRQRFSGNVHEPMLLVVSL